MKPLLKKTIIKLSWILEELRWKLIKPLLPNTKYLSKQRFTFGITTFMDRYDSCLKPLVKKISLLFPNCQIIVIANGHIKHSEQLFYIDDITKFGKNFKNVEIITYQEPKGLSFLWNTIVRKAINNKILILNDDLQIKVDFARFLSTSGILDKKIATINSSWSHFLITVDIFNIIGPFDEGLIEIGGEDDDYIARLAINDIMINDYKSDTIANKLKLKNKRLIVNSYGKNMNEESNGYSTYNNIYLSEKWQMSNEPFDGATEVPNRTIRYWKIRKNVNINNMIL